VLHQVLKQGKFASGVVITFQVMAFAGMSPGHPDAVCAFSQGGQKKLGVHPASTGDSNHPDVGWVFHPPNPCQVGSTVAAPVAQKSYDFRFPFRHFFNLLNTSELKLRNIVILYNYRRDAKYAEDFL
jgi:hypothetical protein